jgi:DNA-directed RNA polymerase specialized sigma24 family protein
VSVEVELARVVNGVVKRYAARCWWADPDDLRQEAWIAAMEAHKGWNPEKGPIGPYAHVAVRRAVAAFLLHETSPVSSSWHERHNLVPLQRSGVDALEATASSPEATWADELLDDARWHVRVLARLLDLLGPEGENDLDLLVGETKRVGRPPFWLLDLTEAQRACIAQDPELRVIWEERK